VQIEKLQKKSSRVKVRFPYLNPSQFYYPGISEGWNKDLISEVVQGES